MIKKRSSGLSGFFNRFSNVVTKATGKPAAFIIATLVICSFQSLESLTTPPESNSFGPAWMPKMWTFVYSTRYFVIPMFLFQVLFFLLVNEVVGNKSKNKTAQVISKSLYALALFAAFFQWAYTTKQYHFGNGAASFWTNGKSEIRIFHLLNKACDANPAEKIIYSYLTYFWR